MGRLEIYSYTKPLTYKTARVHDITNANLTHYITDNYNFPYIFTDSEYSSGRSEYCYIHSFDHNDYTCIDPECYEGPKNVQMYKNSKTVDVTALPSGCTRKVNITPNRADFVWELEKPGAVIPDPLPKRYMYVNYPGYAGPYPVQVTGYSYRIIDYTFTIPRVVCPTTFTIFRDNPTLWHYGYGNVNDKAIVSGTPDVRFTYYTAYTIPDNITVNYHVYANSKFNNYSDAYYVDSIEVWVDGIDTYHNGMHIVLPERKIYETSDKTQYHAIYIDCDISDWRYTWEQHVLPIPGLDLSFKNTKFRVDLYRNNSDTPSTTTVSTGNKMWIHPVYTGSELIEGETLGYSCYVNEEELAFVNGWSHVNLEPDTTYTYTVTCVKQLNNAVVDTYTVSETFSTLTALMYFDKDGNFGIGAYPEEDSVTCNALNLYEPGYTDYEYPLFSFRELVDYNTYNYHSLLFKPTSPVVEDGDLITITGKFTLIQILYKQDPTIQGAKYLKKPSVYCTAVDGTGELWSIPESEWTCDESYPIGNYENSNETTGYTALVPMYQIQRVVYTANTSVTIDTSIQLDKEFTYSVHYYSYSGSTLTDINFADTRLKYSETYKSGKWYYNVTEFSPGYFETVLSYTERTAYEYSSDYDTTIPEYVTPTGVVYGPEVVKETGSSSQGNVYYRTAPSLKYDTPYLMTPIDFTTNDYSEFNMQDAIDEMYFYDTTNFTRGGSLTTEPMPEFVGKTVKEVNQYLGIE